MRAADGSIVLSITGSILVSVKDFGKLRFKNEHEQQIWQECSRLITNCIIIYNATILSNLLAYRESVGDIEGAAALKKVSPVAWQHINLYGRYEFTKAQDVSHRHASNYPGNGQGYRYSQ